MKGFIGKSALVLCGLIFTIAIIGQIFPQSQNVSASSVVTEKVLVPGGQSVGVKMDVRGVLIVGLEEIVDKDGNKINPGLLSGLQIGDMIVEIDGTEVYRAEDVQKLVNEIGDTVMLKVKRNFELINVGIDPVISKDEGVYKLGIWIKDKTAGIGTLTYYDPSNSTFGAIGHGIVDPESGAILSVDSGVLLEAQVQEIFEGKSGEPGEIKGVFYHADDPVGNLVRNSEYGIFGTTYHPIQNELYTKPLAVGSKEQVELGKAYILSTLENNEIRRFEVEIVKLEKQKESAGKSMVIKVTDEELINECGGIVQGMSGSPIIQNDRIIGAVTHVFVNDPTRGYGIYIEWMLQESSGVEN